MYNVAISSADIKARSGQAFGEIKSPTTLSGPAFFSSRLLPFPMISLRLHSSRYFSRQIALIGFIPKSQTFLASNFLQILFQCAMLQSLLPTLKPVLGRLLVRSSLQPHCQAQRFAGTV